MTVADLIEELSQVPPTAVVIINSGYGSIESVTYDRGRVVVVPECSIDPLSDGGDVEGL